MAYNVEGTFFEACSCDVVCPCVTSGFTAPADTKRCGAILVFNIARGEIDGLDVGGHIVALVVDAPEIMADGGWRVGVLVDDKADSEQVDALAKLFSGEYGGPMAAVGALFGEVLGVEQASITYADDGRIHRIQVEGAIDAVVEDFVAPQNPDGPVYQLTGLFYPVNSTLTIARGKRSVGKAFGMEWDYTDKSALTASFAWSA